MYRTEVCLETIRRVRRLLNKVIGVRQSVDIHKLMYPDLMRLPGEWLTDYQFRFLGLDPDDPRHQQYAEWVFDLHWQNIDPLGTAWAYRIMFILSEFPLPSWPIENLIDWRLTNRLYPYADLSVSGESYLNVTKYLYQSESEPESPWVKCRVKSKEKEVHA